MNQKTIYGVFSTLLLMAAMLFTACADELVTNNEVQQSETENLKGLTCFTTEGPDDTRTSIDKGGVFRWTSDDYIYVKDDSNKWQRSKRIELEGGGSSARFYLPGDFNRTKEQTEKNPYPVVYSKSWNPKDGDPTVTIPSEQIQSAPNNSDHLGNAGDCAWASAKRKDDGNFRFELGHQMAYIMFEPCVRDEANEGNKKFVLNRVTITETSTPKRKDIYGVISFSENGAVTGATFNGDSVITVLCGKDVKRIETGQPVVGDTIYGFLIKNNTYAPYKDPGETGATGDGDHYDPTTKKDPLGRVYIVVKPGTYKFKIEYEISTEDAYEQTGIHTIVYKNKTTEEERLVTGTDIPKYESDSNWEKVNSYWTAVPRKYTAIRKRESPENTTLLANHYYSFRHKLEVPNGPDVITGEYDYQFGGYYMWGAKEWFWKNAETAGAQYPVTYDGKPKEGVPVPTQGDDSWFYDDIQTASDGVTKLSSPYNWNSSCWTIGEKIRHRQANARGLHLWNNGSALTANQMSYYVVYGDPHYDNTTPWTLQYYRGFNDYEGNTIPIVCYGGVWLKKKAAIERDNGVTFPGNDDSQKSSNLAAPWTRDAAAGQSENAQIAGKQYNLRYCAPWANYRKSYTNLDHYKKHGEWKKPWKLDTNKDSLDYFFVPCLGRIEYKNSVPTFTLVGTQGFYWTRTPVAYNFGSSSYFYNGGGSGYDYANTTVDNAFYLNLHYDYIALSWQQNSIYVKTGMRVATWNSTGFKFY